MMSLAPQIVEPSTYLDKKNGSSKENSKTEWLRSQTLLYMVEKKVLNTTQQVHT